MQTGTCQSLRPLKVPVRVTSHRVSPIVRETHLVLYLYNLHLPNFGGCSRGNIISSYWIGGFINGESKYGPGTSPSSHSSLMVIMQMYINSRWYVSALNEHICSEPDARMTKSFPPASSLYMRLFSWKSLWLMLIGRFSSAMDDSRKSISASNEVRLRPILANL